MFSFGNKIQSLNPKYGTLDNFFFIEQKKKTKINANADLSWPLHNVKIFVSAVSYNKEIF